MATPSEILILRAPQFTDAALNAQMITEAQALLRDAAFGTQLNTAVALQAAHWLEQRDMAGRAGAISSETEGGLSRSWSINPDDLATTLWGRELLLLMKRTTPPLYIREVA